MIASYVGENKEFERQFLAGELEVELNPQGTLAERIRAGGAGLGGFFTPTGAGTQIAQGKESRVIDGREMIFEKPLKADYAIVRAWKGDKWGNLVFRKTARNFSPMMCTAARITIAEVEHLVDVGELDGDLIHVPSVYVKRIFQGSSSPTSTRFSTSAMVTRAAVAILGLNLRAVLRKTRLPHLSPFQARTIA